MAYEKIGFNKGDVLKAEHLNHIEEGLKNLSHGNASIQNSLSKDSLSTLSSIQLVFGSEEDKNCFKTYKRQFYINTTMTDSSYVGTFVPIGPVSYWGVFSSESDAPAILSLHIYSTTPLQESLETLEMPAKITCFDLSSIEKAVDNFDEIELNYQEAMNLLAGSLKIFGSVNDHKLYLSPYNFSPSF